MTQGTLKVHTENILPIIKKWLYSDKDIFLRELVSNACDALEKLKILREKREISAKDEEFLIEIKTDKEARTLKISDTGIGMTGEEVEKYIAQIAFSGAEEFLGKYQTQNEKDQIIGHFGLGFYSAYMVAEKVHIDTVSYLPESSSVLWTCDGSSSYTMDKGERASRGTEITLFIDKENEEFLEESKVKSILQHYCAFLPFPIYLNGTQINAQAPLWLKQASECTDKDYLDFYHYLYPLEPDPIFWIHLNVDYPFHLKGILYFPKTQRRLDWAQSTIKLFCNRVFVSDNCKDLIPEYLMILRGVIDSPDIPLNVSRSYLQMDRVVRQLASHISKKVSDRLTSLYEQEKEKFLHTWNDIEMIVKLGILQDDKFYERSKNFVIWKNTEGAWTTLEEYVDKHKEAYHNKIFYTVEDKEHSSSFLELYKSKEIEVLYANGHIDNALMNFLEGRMQPLKFQRIDGAIDSSILDASKEKTVLDAEGRTEAAKIAEFFRSKLGIEKLQVEAKSLTSERVPAFVVLDEHMRRMRDYMALSNQPFPSSLTEKKTLVVNTNSKLISSIYTLRDTSPELAKEMAIQTYELALLSQKELDPSLLPQFVARSSRVLEMLAELKT